MAKSDLDAVVELAARLDTVDLDGPSAIDGVLRDLRALAGIETLVCASPVERVTGWDLERFVSLGSANDQRFEKLTAAFLATAPRRLGWFDGATPENDQRDVVIELTARVSRAEYRSSPVVQDLLAPMRLEEASLTRVVLTDAGAMIGWLGAFQAKPLDERQRAILADIAPALRRRLVTERRLANAPVHAAALDAVLARIGVPAYVVTTSGRIRSLNATGRALLERDPNAVRESLEGALAGGRPTLPFELTPLRSSGSTVEWLAILQARTPEAKLLRSIEVAAHRLQLTRRQTEILDLLIRGTSNAEIASQLEVTERAVEQHVSAIFDRAGVENRSTLIAMVLLAS